jgi:membrane protease YdiL (CAAX protease family)
MSVVGQNPNIRRNIVIFVLGAYTLSIAGGVIMAGGNDVGGLVFVIGPLLMAVLLRFFGGDGWRDAGLGLKLKNGLGWYVFSLLAYPLTFVVVIALGVLAGVTSFNHSLPDLLSLLLAGFAANLIPRMVFALFEEWGWRGYLEPRLSALGVPDLRRHIIVGLIWAVWHFPLILATDYTDVQLGVFLPLFVIGVVVAAIVYGQVRKASNTVWTAVLMHGVANALAFGIVADDLMRFSNKVLAYIAPESVLTIVVWGLMGWWLLRYTRSRANHPILN